MKIKNPFLASKKELISPQRQKRKKENVITNASMYKNALQKLKVKYPKKLYKRVPSEQNLKFELENEKLPRPLIHKRDFMMKQK